LEVSTFVDAPETIKEMRDFGWLCHSGSMPPVEPMRSEEDAVKSSLVAELPDTYFPQNSSSVN